MTDELLDTGTEDLAPITDEAEVAAPVERGPSIDDAIAGAFDKAEQQREFTRDEAGRFAAKQAEEQAALDAAKEQQPVEQAVVQPPAAWGRERAAMFAALPPEAQAYIAQREQQVADGFKRYEGCAEYADVASRNGKSLRDVLDTVKQLEDLMEADPIRGAMTIFQRAGFDPRQIAEAILGQPVQQMAQPQAIPSHVEQQLRTLQQQLDQVRIQPFEREVQAFAADPQNKHFDKLSGVMAQLMTADPSLSLREAYDRAAWADPQVRDLLLTESERAKEAARKDQLAKTAQRASQASKGLVPSAAQAASTKQRAMSIDESIAAAFAANS